MITTPPTRYFVVTDDGFPPKVLHVEAAPQAPAAYDGRRAWHLDVIAEEQAPCGFHEVTADTEEAAGRAALLEIAQRRAAQDAQAYAYDRADEDDEQAAPEPDRRPGADQLALWAAGPQRTQPNITRMAHTQDLISTP
ncbi:hypothetical protein ACFYUJ_39035 [Streptomyces sp. NPDC004520]|uniref:hypothetical protein n=1 Tax=Streptomyces sp. NPDC004520 TaxID=3364702 RepID=UPI0036C48173